jgi:CubicO group peptidase (beta-lactamase class C family)
MPLTAQLDAYFQQRTAQDEFSGVVLITQGDTPRYARAYGYASCSWQVPNTLETCFDTASITKLFTSVATLQLVDQGLLALDTPVAECLGLPQIHPGVTVFHLLTHSSGIADDADEEAGESYEDLWISKPNYSVTETRDFLPQFIDKPANFAPGEGCRYCNVGYVLLGLLIEQASGQSYRDYVRANIFARAAMYDCDFFRMDRVNRNVAEGCDPLRDANGQITGWKKNIYSYPPIGSPDGGAHVTASDLHRFLRAVQRGELISPALTQAFFTPQVVHTRDENGTTMYSYGLWFALDPAGQVVFYEKEGYNAGVSGMIRYYPALDTSVVILSNMSSGAWEPIKQVHNVLIGSQ